MKKKMLSLAVAAILSVGMTTAFAQTSSQQDQAGDKKECCKKDEKKCDKKGDRKGGCCKGDEKKCCKDLFEGLNLTEQQQAALQEIPTPGATLKAAREQNTEQQMNDETRALFVKNVFTDYLGKVKGVLTADQYTQFLENFYVNASIKKMDKGHGDKKMKGDRKGGDKKKGDKKKGDRKGGERKGERKA